MLSLRLLLLAVPNFDDAVPVACWTLSTYSLAVEVPPLYCEVKARKVQVLLA
jgi:hypothetical protein